VQCVEASRCVSEASKSCLEKALRVEVTSVGSRPAPYVAEHTVDVEVRAGSLCEHDKKNKNRLESHANMKLDGKQKWQARPERLTARQLAKVPMESE